MKDHIESGDPDRTGFYLVPWTCNEKREKEIQEDSKATIRCYPLDLNQANMADGKTCFYSGEPATHMALFARAF
jgi:prolyl-tRNA synthetase